MDDFFDDDDFGDLDLDDMPLPGAYGSKPTAPQQEEQKGEDAIDDGKRKIQRYGTFKQSKWSQNPDFKSLALPMKKDEGDNSEGIKWMEDYMIIKEELGKGGFCKVKAADVIVHRDGKDKATGEDKKIKGTQHMALKVFNRMSLRGQKTQEVDPITGFCKPSDQLKTIMNEIKVWETVANDNICKIFELYDCDEVSNIYLMMELCQFGQIQKENPTHETLVTRSQSIFDVAVPKGKKVWPKDDCNDIESATKWVFYQVAEAMRFLHDDMGIVHRDLKHENILMGKKKADPYNEDERQEMIKVCDFTTATILPKDDPNFKVSIDAGTPAFNAPEVSLTSEKLPKPLDIWSFGITLYVYFTNNLPYPIEGDMEKNIQKCDYKNQISKLDCSQTLKDLMENILEFDPVKRPTFKEILGHKWFEGRVEEVFDCVDEIFYD